MDGASKDAPFVRTAKIALVEPLPKDRSGVCQERISPAVDARS